HSRTRWTRMRAQHDAATQNARVTAMTAAASRRPAAPQPAAPTAIPFIDLQAQRRRIAGPVERASARVLEPGQDIMGPESGELERRLAEYCGVKHAVSCGSGTDALLLLLMAQGCGPGDAVFCPSFTFAASAEVIALTGATPVFVDIARDDY